MTNGVTAQAPAPRTAERASVVARASIYRFLAGVFTSPPTPAAVRCVRDMAKVLGLACPDDWPLDELAQDYSALLVVPGPRYVAPYESVYRDAWQPRVAGRDAPAPAGDTRDAFVKGLLMGDSTLEVQACYREAGVFPEGEIPDHISNELRFMAYLSLRRATTADEGGRLADLHARFRNEHLLKWLDLLGKRIRENERTRFYSLVVHVAEIVLQNDV